MILPLNKVIRSVKCCSTRSGAREGANFIAEGTLAVLSRKQVLIKLTEEQSREVQEMLGKEVTYVLLRLIGESVIFAEV